MTKKTWEFSWPQDRMFRRTSDNPDPDADYWVGVADIALTLFCVAKGSSDGAAFGEAELKRMARWLTWRVYAVWEPSVGTEKGVEDCLRVYCTACLDYAMTHDPVLSKGDSDAARSRVRCGVE